MENIDTRNYRLPFYKPSVTSVLSALNINTMQYIVTTN